MHNSKEAHHFIKITNSYEKTNLSICQLAKKQLIYLQLQQLTNNKVEMRSCCVKLSRLRQILLLSFFRRKARDTAFPTVLERILQ